LTTVVTTEALFVSMPVLAAVRHLTNINTDRITAGITEFSEHFLEANTTDWVIISHHIPLSAQRAVTLVAREMSQMPETPFRFCAFV